MSKNVLVIAAHPDDEVLGLGGTLARHVRQGDQVFVAIIADKGSARYDEATIEQVRQCALEASNRLGVANVCFARLDDQKLDTLPLLQITQWIERLIREIRPEIIYTHHHGDINYDHQIVHKATLTAARPYSAPYVKRILAYETPSGTEWAGPYSEKAFCPNVYINITPYLPSKLEAISAYKTELRDFPHPRSVEALQSRATYWGSMIGVASAEAFMLVREID